MNRDWSYRNSTNRNSTNLGSELENLGPAVFGNVPHGEPLDSSRSVGVFGFTVEGLVLLPGVAGFVEFEPGTPEGEAGVAEPQVASPDWQVGSQD